MKRHRVLGIGAIVSIATLCIGLASAEDKHMLDYRIFKATHSTAIRDVDMSPWHLKFNIELYDTKGNMKNKGTVEEWWADFDHSRIQIETTSYKTTIIQNEKGYFQTKGTDIVPFGILDLEKMIVQPVDLFKSVTFRSDNKKSEASSLDCIEEYSSSMKNSMQPVTYCFEPGKEVLREIHSRNPGNAVFSNIEEFQNRSVARAITMETKKWRGKAEVTDLSEMPLPSNLFLLTPDMAPFRRRIEIRMIPQYVNAPTHIH